MWAIIIRNRLLLSASLTTLWHLAVVVTLLWISLFKALFPTWRRSILTQWSQSHPLFRLNGKNRLPVSWRYPPPPFSHAPTQPYTPLCSPLSPSLTHLILTLLPPISAFLISLFPLLPLSLSPSLSLPHPSLTAFCSNSGVTSCRKSHGSWLEKSDLKQSQNGSQTARAFFDYRYTTAWLCLSFISLQWKPVALFPFLLNSSLLLFSSSLFTSQSLRSC